MPARPSAQDEACRSVLGPIVPTSRRGPPWETGRGPTGTTESVTFSPDHTCFITATRRAISRMVWVAGSALTAW